MIIKLYTIRTEMILTVLRTSHKLLRWCTSTNFQSATCYPLAIAVTVSLYLRKCSFLRYLKANSWYLLADTAITWITDSGKVESNHRMVNLCPALPFKLLPLSKGESDCNGHICVSYGLGFHQAVKCCGISLDRYQADGLSPSLTVVLTGVEEITYLSRKKR
mgnify:CR=1 FL=1